MGLCNGPNIWWDCTNNDCGPGNVDGTTSCQGPDSTNPCWDLDNSGYFNTYAQTGDGGYYPLCECEDGDSVFVNCKYTIAGNGEHTKNNANQMCGGGCVSRSSAEQSESANAGVCTKPDDCGFCGGYQNVYGHGSCSSRGFRCDHLDTISPNTLKMGEDNESSPYHGSATSCGSTCDSNRAYCPSCTTDQGSLGSGTEVGMCAPTSDGTNYHDHNANGYPAHASCPVYTECSKDCPKKKRDDHTPTADSYEFTYYDYCKCVGTAGAGASLPGHADGNATQCDNSFSSSQSIEYYCGADFWSSTTNYMACGSSMSYQKTFCFCAPEKESNTWHQGQDSGPFTRTNHWDDGITEGACFNAQYWGYNESGWGAGDISEELEGVLISCDDCVPNLFGKSKACTEGGSTKPGLRGVGLACHTTAMENYCIDRKGYDCVVDYNCGKNDYSATGGCWGWNGWNEYFDCHCTDNEGGTTEECPGSVVSTMTIKIFIPTVPPPTASSSTIIIFSAIIIHNTVISFTIYTVVFHCSCMTCQSDTTQPWFSTSTFCTRLRFSK
jgi:hypothetical protein